MSTLQSEVLDLRPGEYLLTSNDVCIRLNAKKSSLYEWTRDRRIESIKLEKELRYHPRAVEAFVAQRTRKTNEQLAEEVEKKRSDLTLPSLERPAPKAKQVRP